MEQEVKAAVQPPSQLNRDELLQLYSLMYRGRQLDLLIERWQRMGRSHFYIGAAGHKRPGVRAGLPVPEARQKARELSEQIEGLAK